MLVVHRLLAEAHRRAELLAVRLRVTGRGGTQHLVLVKDEPLARFIREQAASVRQAAETVVRAAGR